MSLGAYAATRGAGSPAAAGGQRIQDGRRGQRGKNGSARPPGTHKLRYIVSRGGGTRASCGLQSAPAPILKDRRGQSGFGARSPGPISLCAGFADGPEQRERPRPGPRKHGGADEDAPKHVGEVERGRAPVTF